MGIKLSTVESDVSDHSKCETKVNLHVWWSQLTTGDLYSCKLAMFVQ